MHHDLLIEAAEPIAVAAVKKARYPALEQLIARGDPLAPPTGPLDRALFDLFRIPADLRHGLAALARLGDGGVADDDYWLRLDPVCLRPTRTRLTLASLPPGDLTAPEASELAAALSADFGASGYQIEVRHPERWYVRCPVAPQMQTLCPALCAGVLDEQHLPSGPDAPTWRRLITEAQMLLHEAPVNVARAAAGKLPANAIWPWGGGRLPHLERGPYACVLAADPLALGLARATGAQALLMPAPPVDAIAQAVRSAASLIVAAGAATPAVNSLRACEENWFAPLAAALDAGTIGRLRILLLGPDRGIGRELERANLRRWWRRARPLKSYA